jgi:hypothetical protein
MNLARGDFTATMLPDGNVLVAGGYNNTYGAISNAELYGPISATINLSGAGLLPSGAFQFAFAGLPHSTNMVLTSTNLTLPLSDWTALGSASEFSPGLFVFTDTEATNYSSRFYRALAQ